MDVENRLAAEEEVLFALPLPPGLQFDYPNAQQPELSPCFSLTLRVQDQ